MDLERFVRERRERWARLETLLSDVERLPSHALGVARLDELVRLYRQTCSDLSEARSLTANAELLGRLNALAGKGYRFIYRRAYGRRLIETVRRFFTDDVPATFSRERGVVLCASLAFLAGAIVGLGAVLRDARNGERLIPAEFFSESPRARVERIESGEERVDSLAKAGEFGAYLFSHNIQVAFLAFSLGAVTIVGGLWILFYNGVILGAIAGLYLLDGVHVFFLAWVGPHGALEIPAILFGGAAGLRLGRALLLPGDLTVATTIRRAFASVWRMLIAAALILIIAGLVEGSFSQFSAKTIPYALKIAAAVALLLALGVYLFRRPVRSVAEGPWAS
ncbi:MAG: stage II sporulation protein M [Vicinamibacteria bacterium]|nr:stage II sporulation protein M [Vicinamibacteria bacterium]